MKASDAVRDKLLQKHNVTLDEVEQCFANRDRGSLEDTRVNRQTSPPTMWFISDTFWGRRLKIVFMLHSDGDIEIKTAYEPNAEEIRIYNKFSAPRN